MNGCARAVPLMCLVLLAGAPVNAQPRPAVPMSGDLGLMVSQLERAAQATSAQLRQLRVDKWKADSDTRRALQQNVDSLTRNLDAALPGMIQQLRSAPNSVAAHFKLYRNVNALYDVLSGVAESAGAFGPKNEYEALVEDLNALDRPRLALANQLEFMTAQQDAEIARLRSLQAGAARAAASPAAPKKIVIDNDEQPVQRKKAPAKKKAANPPS